VERRAIDDQIAVKERSAGSPTRSTGWRGPRIAGYPRAPSRNVVSLLSLPRYTSSSAGKLSTRKRTQLSVKLLLLVGVTALMLGLAEAGARLFFDLPLAHMQDRDGHYVSFLVDDAELEKFGHRNFDGVQVAAEYRNEVATNAQGFRAPGDYGPKRDGAFRVLALGDSFTFGLGVEQDETFEQVLEGRLRERYGDRVECLNLGVVGYGTLQELKILERHRDLAPDLVILGFYARNAFGSAGGNDLVDNYQFSKFAERAERKRAGEEDGSPVAAGRTPQPLARRIRGFLIDHSKLYRLFEATVGGVLRTHYEPADDVERKREAWEITALALHALDAKLAELGVRGLLLWIPYPRAIAAQDASIVERLESLRLENIAIVSLLEPMKGAPMDYYYRLDSHWNARGHEVAADALFRAIVDEQLVPE
jgi:lysophospholipase L1-like esterase